MYKACIISESLHNQEIFSWPQISLLETKVYPYKEEMQTPWLSQWTFNWITFNDAMLNNVIEFLSKNIGNGKEWYTDLQSDQEKVFIFRDRVFHIANSNPKEALIKQYREVVDYGISVGIPAHQMDITPEEFKETQA